VTWIGPSGTYTLIHTNAGSSADGNFHVSTIKDADSSSPVINDPDDRIRLDFNVSNFAGSELGEGEEVTVQINTMAGATTEIRFTVPQSLDGKTAVEL
jgi:flagellin FlaA/flagellin FlaB